MLFAGNILQFARTGPFPSGVTAAGVDVGPSGVSRGGVDTGAQAQDRIRETVRNVFRFIDGLILLVGTVLFHLCTNIDSAMIERSYSADSQFITL
jgi:hypothetical protein